MKLSLQLYTVRDDIAKDRAGTLNTIASFGIKYVEGGFVGDALEDWKKDLAAAGLQFSGAHVSIETLESSFDAVVAEAKSLDYKFVIVPWVSDKHYGEGWDKLGERLCSIGEKLATQGLTLLYHNHDFEFKNGDGLAQMMEAADAANLGAELDVAWVQIGGHDPLEYVKKLSDRVKLLHLKDFDPNTTPRWRPAGTGKVNLKAIVDACPNIEYGAIELDESPGAPLDAVKQSADYLRSIGLV